MRFGSWAKRVFEAFRFVCLSRHVLHVAFAVYVFVRHNERSLMTFFAAYFGAAREKEAGSRWKLKKGFS